MQLVEYSKSYEHNPRLEVVLERYENALRTLKEAIEKSAEITVNQLPVQLVLDVLVARDALQRQLETAETPAESLVKVSELDRGLREQFEALPRKVCQEELRKILTQLEDLRDVCEPPKKAWWWFLEIPVCWWDRFDLAWDTLAVLWLAATFSLLTDISSRFLIGGGGPGLFGSFAVIFQSILALSGGGALTKTGQTVFKSTLKRWRVPRHLWQEAKFVAASLLLLIFVGFRLSLPGIAVVYRNAGVQDYKAGRLASAESNYKRALKLNPDDGKTHLYLGSLYETLQDFKSAHTEYQIAMRSGSVAAFNNIARLYILDENYAAAASLLKWSKALITSEDVTSEDGKKLLYSLHKNLGWVHWEQGRLAEAEAELLTAIEDLAEPAQLSPERQASAHCLLAQVLDAKGEPDQASLKWEYCLRHARGLLPEEAAWLNRAQERLKSQKFPQVEGGGS